jgi:ribosome-binding protein aMBF1 (putative translation factor)
MEKEKVDFRITLRAARISKGLSREGASKKLNISPSTLKNYETGKTIPGWDMVGKFEELYEIPKANLKIG